MKRRWVRIDYGLNIDMQTTKYNLITYNSTKGGQIEGRVIKLNTNLQREREREK